MFTISPPSPHDAPTIASIHISSMSSNPLLRLQFPTAASLADLHDHLAADALRHLAESRVLVARAGRSSDSNNETGDNASAAPEEAGGPVVASFAKWDLVGVPPAAAATALGSQRLDAGRGDTAEQQHQDGRDDVVQPDGQQDEEEEEEWPASANREYLTAYSSAASSARRAAMGSRPFFRE